MSFVPPNLCRLIMLSFSFEAADCIFFCFQVCLRRRKQRLLHCAVVGGGPTGVEFSGELSDFIMRDVHQRYAHVKNSIHVTLVEVGVHKKISLGDGGLSHDVATAISASPVVVY